MMTWLLTVMYDDVASDDDCLEAGYLLVGLVMMMWLLTVFAEIPQLNFGILFLHQSDETTSDPEKVRLSGPAAGPSYSRQVSRTSQHDGRARETRAQPNV